MKLYLKSFKLIIPTFRRKKQTSFIILFFHILQICLLIIGSYWYKNFYNALQEYNVDKLIRLSIYFIILASSLVIISGFKAYFERFLEFSIREDLYERFSKKWINSRVSNPEQRLHEDTIKFAKIMIKFLEVLVKSILELPAYIFIIFEVTNIYIVIFSLTYIILGTYISSKIAKPLIHLENDQEKREAEFRKEITYKVDNKDINLPPLNFIKENWIELAKKTKNLTFYVTSYSQGSIFFQLLILLPSYLSKKISLGEFIQSAQALTKVFECLSILINSRDILVEMQMLTIRLTEMDKINKI